MYSDCPDTHSRRPIAVWSLNSSLNGAWQPISVTKLTSTWTFNPSIGNVTGLLATGNAYYNAHTTAYPNGEIRGQFAALSLKRGGDGAVVIDQNFTIPIEALNATVTVNVLCDVVIEGLVPKLTCDLSLPKLKDPRGKALTVSINTQMLWNVIVSGYKAIKPLIDPIIDDIAAAMNVHQKVYNLNPLLWDW